jgi:hypothetical protein
MVFETTQQLNRHGHQQNKFALYTNQMTGPILGG